ncbi:MAG: DUF6785 family protein [Phycisphaerae bacterium]
MGIHTPLPLFDTLHPPAATTSILPGTVPTVPNTTLPKLLAPTALPPLQDNLVPAASPVAVLTRRTFWLGLFLVALMAILTPYNDYVLGNTPLIGNHFPIGVFALMAGVILGLNPLLQWVGKKRLSPADLAVIWGMLLCAAAVPSSGLIRYWEPNLLGPFRALETMPWLRPIAQLLPGWTVPTRDFHAPLLRNYMLGIDPAQGDRIPILPFILPALTWGLLAAAIFSAIMCLAAIFRKQWVQHERLSYPLAMIPLELMGAPAPGQYYNPLWRSGLLWAGAALPAIVYGLSGLHSLFPAVPFMSLSYDFSSAFTERPWDHLPHYLIANRLYFSVVGLSFFIPTQVAFSLWLFLVIKGLTRVAFADSSIDPGQMEPIRDMGIYLGYFAALLWLARAHLWHVLRSAWYGTLREPMEPASYRTLVVGFVLSVAVAWAWLVAAGISPVVAALVLGLGLMLVTLMSRIAAETGMFFLGISWQINRFFEIMLGPRLIQGGNFYLSGVVSNIFFTDLRENLMPFATTSSRLSQETTPAHRPQFFRWCVIALALSTLLAGLSDHFLSFHYGRQIMHDEHAVTIVPTQNLTDAHRFAHIAPAISPGRAWLHFGFGVGMVGALMAGRLLWVSWPFHPIGLLLMNAWTLEVFWFSIFVGWGLKQILLRYGGAMFFRRARGFFIGLIVGEMLAAGLWMLLGLLSNGVIRFQLLPG